MTFRWTWSSYRATAGLEAPPSWPEIDWTLAQFHPSSRQRAHERYGSIQDVTLN